MTRAHVRVHGRVQGVFFRVDAQARARSLGIAGWVRNCPDGTVEAVFEGGRDSVQSMVDWCGRGPAGASVEGVDVAWQEPEGELEFRVV